MSKPLHLYKRMLLLAKQLPKGKRKEAISTIQDSWRKHKTETDSERVKEYFRTAESKLRFLQMSTPRRARGHRDPSEAGGGVHHYVVNRDGAVDDGAAEAQGSARHSKYIEGNVDPEMLSKHQANMRRFHFMDRE